MQTVGTPLLTLLRTRDRDLITVYELYDADYAPAITGFDPRDALQTFSGIKYTLPFGPTVYRREVLQGPTIRKSMGKEFNTASIRFSNVSRYMSDFVLKNEVEQMRLVVRTVSRSVATSIGNDGAILANSIVVFVGRCQKPDGFNRSTGTISAKPDMGTIEAQIPPRQFMASCPLEFKGAECLGTELLSEKSAAYQAASTCNLTFQQCSADYENEEFFQGVRVIQIQSSFVHKSNESFFKKILNILPGISRRKTTVNNSLYDGTPYGKPIPIILGRWYKTLLPLQFQDVGTSIRFLMAACRGKISDFINLRTLTLNFSAPLSVIKHLGEYGGDGTQTQDTVFPEGGFFSRLAYITGYCTGTDIEVQDPAPEIAAVIAGIVPDSIYDDVDHDGTGKLALGTGGTSAPGSSSSAPGTPFAGTYDAWIASKTPVTYHRHHDGAGVVLVDDGPNGIDGECPPLASQAGLGHIKEIDGPIETESPCFGISGPVAFVPPSGLGADVYQASPTNLVNDFTWVVRMKWESGGARIAINKSGVNVSDFFIAFGAPPGAFGSPITASVGDNDGVAWKGTHNEPTVSGHWYQTVVTRQGSSLRMYVDGCLADQTDSFQEGPLTATSYTNNPWQFGFLINRVFGPVNRSQGLSHVALFDYTWTEEDVKTDHATSLLVPTGCPGPDWIDNPVDLSRYVLTEPALMGNDDNSIDDYLSAYAAAYNCGSIKDDSNAERVLLPDSQTSLAGIDYKRYNSTGLLGPLSFQSSRTQIPAGVPAREAEYEFFDPAAPPDSLDVELKYRKRFTCNIEVSEVRKAVDVLYDTIFPTFRGFLRWNPLGQTVIDNERPADWTTLRSASIVGATTLTVQDVLPWKNILGSPYLLHGKVHIAIQPTWTYANSTLRTGATGFIASDVGKYAHQIEGNSLWKLTAITPTWLEVSDASEVRAVTAVVYSALGNAITLASSASGGPSATPSGANLTGGSTTVQSSGTVTITGTLTNGSSITVTIDGHDCVLDLVNGDSSATIGHRMAAVINATPEVNTYIEAHATNNVVTIYSKIGVLTLSSALEEAHTVNEEITRVMMSFAGKVLTYADTTRANILDGSFGWPDASRQSLVNQIKTKFRESVLDFGEQPLVLNDFNHQRKIRKVNTFEVDHSAVDNYNQSARLTNGLLNTLRDGDRFFEWASMGEALLLDEGDVVCVSDDSGPFRNQLVRLNEIGISNQYEATFIARKYSRLQLSDLAAQPAGLVLPSGLNFQTPPPEIQFNTVDFPPAGLEQTGDGSGGVTTIRGGAVFGAYLYGQHATVRLLMRAGVEVNEIITNNLVPNEDLEGTFEFLASAEGLYKVELEVCNNINQCNSIKPVATIVISFSTQFGIAKEGGTLITKEGGVFIDREN